MRFIGTAALVSTLAFAQGRSYSEDMAKSRAEYANTETVAIQSANRPIVFHAIGKGKKTFVVELLDGTWEPTTMDSYRTNWGRIKELRDLGFTTMVFVHRVQRGKKEKLVEYAAFEFKQN